MTYDLFIGDICILSNVTQAKVRQFTKIECSCKNAAKNKWKIGKYDIRFHDAGRQEFIKRYGIENYNEWIRITNFFKNNFFNK